MKVSKFLSLGVSGLLSFWASGQTEPWHVKPFPTIREYDGNHLYQIALPLGGIGTGSFSLGGRGELRDWEIMNAPAKRYCPGSGHDRQTSPFFAITFHSSQTSQASQTFLLEGPLYDWERLDEEGRPAEHHGFPRFSNATFSGSFPAGTVHLRDRDLPVEVDVTGFNPFVPGDAEGSGLPVGTLTYAVKNVSGGPLEVSVAGLMRNFIGRGEAKGNVNAFREGETLRGIFFQPGSAVSTNSENWGSMALVTEERAGVSYRTSGVGNNWCWTILDWWDDFSDDGAFTDRAPCGDRDPLATLAVKKTIAPGATAEFTFHLVWHFPNRRAWSKRIEGNWYATKYANAWDAAEKVVPQLPALAEKSRRFTEAMAKSDFPEPIKESALFNLAVFKSQTVFRLPSGHLMGWEGVKDDHGSCYGSCTHVWNYEQATAFLFPDLARTMRDVELNYALMDDGFMNFRAKLPLDTAAAKRRKAAADGQMGCIMKAYREWLISGDREWLRANWPRVKLALSYCWAEDGWDADRDGVMEGSQHNTMDVDYVGPNPQMGFWYLGALRAAEEMAKDAGDAEFAAECRRLYESGSKWMDANLFNGEYYEHLIYDPKTRKPYPEGVEPCAYQIGKGCLVDQLVGQQFAHLLGLGWLGDEKNERAATEAILKYNWLGDFTHHFNSMRSYALGQESGLLMASWPRGRLRRPFPYFGEVMTGFEYVAAVEMIYEGRDEDAVRVIKAIRDRHDGARRNPYSEPECGHNYARSMASWGAINAWTGMRYSAPKGTLTFSAKHEGTFLWSVGKAWGLVTIKDGKATVETLGP